MNEFRPGRYQALPPIVKNLIIINVIMVLLQFILAHTFRIDLQAYLGLHYFRSELFRPWQLLTHIFMHGSPLDLNATLLHIFSNMFALWMFGSILENRWGPKRFLTFYLICGVGAALCYMGTLAVQYEPLYKSFLAFKDSPTLDHFLQFVNQNDLPVNEAFKTAWSSDPGNVTYPVEAVRSFGKYVNYAFNGPMVGASGAVFGVLFAFGYLFPNTELMLIFPPIPIKAKWIVGGYALFELYAGFQNAADDNVAHFAHLGGMLVAFIILKIWQQNRRRFY
jgi:membrane associated rhomboid family serine protease